MFNSLLKKLFGSDNDRNIAKYDIKVQAINALEESYTQLSDEDFPAKTAEFKARLSNGEKLNDLTEEAFACVREAAKRAIGLRPFDVQLIGGLVLHDGMITEMKTGEGKTLVATLPVYLNTLTGMGVHVVTVNDYLAGRDAAWMGKVYQFLGLTVGVVLPGMNDEERRLAYQCDVTYGTNNEFAFDYLRDNLKMSLDEMVQRNFNFAIVDEVDSILIDEARTPLIISGPTEDSSVMYQTINKLIPLLSDDDYELDEKQKAVTLSEKGMGSIEGLLSEKTELLAENASLYDIEHVSLVHHVNQALRAHKLFTPDVDYMVRDGQVLIIDEFTGRVMEGRRYSDGLHQALEARENVKVQMENQTLASITYQNYFRFYDKLAGMTGTALTEAAEFEEIYSLQVLSIPTHRPMMRIDYDDEVYRNHSERDDALIIQIQECYERGQPILIGTVSVEKSESLSKKLNKLKIKHEILNAKNHSREAIIVAQAGSFQAVTIATNMAGRGTDIQLGGNLEMRTATELNPEDSNFDNKKQAIAAEIEENKARVLKAGGLYVIGTERHESRRIDNQLRGRSGRQGDPGASKFYISLEDDLMRIFGSERLEGMLNKIGLEPGEAIIHPWVNKALEKAQQKVEQRNFEVRKQLLRFDDVMNDQRKAIFSQRKEIMSAETISDTVFEMRTDVIDEIISQAVPESALPDQWNLDGLHEEILRVFGLNLPIQEWGKEEGVADKELRERITTAVEGKYADKETRFSSNVLRYIEKSLTLQVIDNSWKDHLLQLDHLRQGIGLRAYAQRDPLNEYKQEAFGLFEALLSRLRYSITQFLFHIEPNVQSENQMPQQRPATDPSLIRESKPADALNERSGNIPASSDKIRRNAACPCGSGKKYKHCHGKL